jgi:hypothetical protein
MTHTGRNKPLLDGSSVPPPVRAVLERACQDCHSENTAWPWYAHLPPVSWKIHSDVAKARAVMNFSKWDSYTESEQQGFREAIGMAVKSHIMPPREYLFLHGRAKLSAEELELLAAWASGASKE